MKYGYVRVSTTDQNLTIQVKALTQRRMRNNTTGEGVHHIHTRTR
jgi:DNA invertase Pin-like site-specific DNA recombinase